MLPKYVLSHWIEALCFCIGVSQTASVERMKLHCLQNRLTSNLPEFLEFTNGMSQSFTESCQGGLVEHAVVQIQHLEILVGSEHRAKVLPKGELLLVTEGDRDHDPPVAQ